MGSSWCRCRVRHCPLPDEQGRQSFSTIGSLICPRFSVKAEAPSIGWLESSKHRKVTHVCGEQVSLEQECGGGDQVVGIVNAAVGAAVALGKRTGGSCHLLPDGHPGQCREELLERLDLA